MKRPRHNRAENVAAAKHKNFGRLLSTIAKKQARDLDKRPL